MLPNISLAADISFCADKSDRNRKQPSMSSSQAHIVESQSLSITINLITGDSGSSVQLGSDFNSLSDLPNLLSTCG
jgi:hypothetical protein